MAGLQAEGINEEFLKNLFPETIYLVDSDLTLPAQPEQIAPESPAPDAIPPAMEQPAALKNQITEHSPAATPHIPHLPIPAAPAKYKLAGTNDRGVVLLVTLPDAEFSQLPQLTFLQKILEAIGLKQTDVAYVNNVSGEIARFEDLEQELQIRYIISFASRLDTELPHDKFTLYHPVLLGDVPVVFSHALAKLENDVEQKKLLWNALQQVFL
ncbi:hypothetical protein MKJ04_02020 [Pontibacter sp. E15-1]|uniref:hypothetical protein n=1 Tax=Pontibacter sp. E15-1 TaxID=2919918 RepID=UPI001F501116|nr:hypothetical protein [Pontibacter sp. E15-1]MCJ8163599.1 hypothetical protein [Pontibacter sp. E15-1]